MASGVQIHVAVTGNDANAGSEVSPFRTISKESNEAHPDDVITIHEGVYRERINLPRCETSD